MKDRRGGSNLRRGSRETRGRTGAKRGPSDTRFQTEVLREVLLCGREMEASGRHLEAMALYDEAMEVVDGDVAPVEVGSILHHVGHRATAVGDGRRALVSYVTAARLFQRHQLAGYCADSLAAAGTAVVDCGGDPPLEQAVEEDALQLGLDDVLCHGRDVLLAVEAPTYDGAMAVHGRLSGLLVVAGQAGYDAPLAAIATALARDVVNPYVERYGVVVRTELDVLVVVAHLFQGLAKLCLAVAQQEQQRRMGAGPSTVQIQSLAGILASAVVGPPHARMAHWLGALLRGRHGVTNVTDEELIA